MILEINGTVSKYENVLATGHIFGLPYRINGYHNPQK